ncbi:hypothetical protein A2690_02840 [Candidatus Roizmanbacteria bacterium RIFCSPHIGHO2_01_FULL_39_12b]|uniref:HicB-like antitoxin of toxin-antitoxin system domain-containing protein n=1 Tax=Candidatus Roizmanbacteria bacterium RIFCSPHIGHO2_01_FULL_39_12b TaxID=1802030 RepID=A0A1F7GBK9_9BACT|nr:MAG: hypothetical protein A2690_02840 [Candidatus Roizmanbacteria bacterium RIFCSPHIGHO2_01_FULL_39_12b]
MEYIAIFQEEKDGGYSVWVPELPGCASQGETVEKAMGNIREAIELYLEDNEQTSTEDASYKKQFVVPIQINYA